MESGREKHLLSSFITSIHSFIHSYSSIYSFIRWILFFVFFFFTFLHPNYSYLKKFKFFDAWPRQHTHQNFLLFSSQFIWVLMEIHVVVVVVVLFSWVELSLKNEQLATTTTTKTTIIKKSTTFLSSFKFKVDIRCYLQTITTSPDVIPISDYQVHSWFYYC